MPFVSTDLCCDFEIEPFLKDKILKDSEGQSCYLPSVAFILPLAALQHWAAFPLVALLRALSSSAKEKRHL